MHLTFIQLSGFVAEWRHFRLSDEDLRALENLTAAQKSSFKAAIEAMRPRG